MCSGGRQGGGEGRLAARHGGARRGAPLPPSRGGGERGPVRRPAGSAGRPGRRAPGGVGGRVGRVFGFEIWLFWKLLELE